MICTCSYDPENEGPHEIWCAMFKKEVPAARRDPVAYRYDVLYWNFIHVMAQIGHFGAEKYGEFNYRQLGLKGNTSPVNHIANHLRKFIENEPYDHQEVGVGRKYHLAAIAFNAMMQFWHEDHSEKTIEEMAERVIAEIKKNPQ
jgi:hypothetical protein